MTFRIAMWSGPRNLSTALMRSFGNRADCTPVDEPLYAAYLAATGLDHPGWDDDRYCPNGLLEMEPRHGGRRPVHAPLALELRRQQAEFAALFSPAAADAAA